MEFLEFASTELVQLFLGMGIIAYFEARRQLSEAIVSDRLPEIQFVNIR